MRRLLSLVAVVCTAGIASAQTLSEYLVLRKQNKITAPVSVASLDSLVGTKVVELKCTVKGIMELESGISLYVEYPDNRGEQVIDATSVPTWLKGGAIMARLLVRATRAEEFGALKLDLLGAASNEEMVKREAAATPAKPPTRATTTTRGTVHRTVSKAPPMASQEITHIYARFIQNHNKKLSYDRAYEIAFYIIKWSLTYKLDARLVVALVITESDFRPATLSSAKAMGLGQLMDVNCKEYGITDPWDTNQNLYGTCRQLREHLNRYRKGYPDLDPEKLKLALAAYNAGPGNVRKHGGVPPFRETQNYIKRVFARYARLVSGD